MWAGEVLALEGEVGRLEELLSERQLLLEERGVEQEAQAHLSPSYRILLEVIN